MGMATETPVQSAPQLHREQIATTMMAIEIRVKQNCVMVLTTIVTPSPDDGLTFVDYFVDFDGDGYGESSTALSACAQP